MAIALDSSSTNQSTSTTTLTWNHTCTGANLILLVCTATTNANDANRPVSTVTYNSVGLTKIREDDDTTNNITTGIWYMMNPPTGSSLAILVTYSGSGNRCGGVGLSLSGVRQDATIPNAGATASGTGTNTSVDITPLSSETLIVDSIYHNIGTVFNSAGVSQTVIQNLDLGATGSMGVSIRQFINPPTATNTWIQSSSGVWITSIVALESIPYLNKNMYLKQGFQ